MARTGLLFASLFALAGCASLLPPGTESVVDQAKVDRIERAATVTGTRVIWVRMPTVRVAEAPPGG